MFSKIEKFKKDEEGAALILTILIAGVLFILSSFLINKVLVNTKIIEKAKEEEESYALAKEGMLYAVEQLNASDQSTDWPGDSNWNNYHLDDDTGDESGYDVSIKVEKDTPSGYITIKSTDLPRKLVTLQGVANYKSPLTKYVRFINSDTTFGDTTFGEEGSGTSIEGRAPIHINGNLILGTNTINLYTTSDTTKWDKFEVTGETQPINDAATITIKDPTGTISSKTLDANNDNSDGKNCGFTVNAAGNLLDSLKFDTVSGRYLDLAHLPSCYDYSSGSPTFYYGGSRSIFWPEINENIYSNLVEDSKYYVSVPGISNTPIYNKGSQENIEDIWYPEESEWDEMPDETNWPGWEETYENSRIYFYTGTGTLIVLDGNGESLGAPLQIGIDDGLGGATAGNDIIEKSEWRDYPSNGLIYSPGNIRVSGMIDNDTTPYNLTIVSGGTIYIEGNIIKENDNSSVALLAKDWVVLNPTHTFTGGYFTGNLACKVSSGEEEDFKWKHKDNLLGEEDNKRAIYQVKGLETLMRLDFEQMMTCDTITLVKLLLNQHWPLSIWGSNNPEFNIPPGDGDIQFGEDITTSINNENIDFTSKIPFTFRYVKIYLVDQREEPEEWVSPFQVDAIKVSLSGGEEGKGDGTWGEDGKPLLNTLCFAQRKSWAVIPGNGDAYPIVIGGAIAENKQEQIDNDWASKLTYTYDSNLSSNHLPHSVNLVSLKRE